MRRPLTQKQIGILRRLDHKCCMTLSHNKVLMGKDRPFFTQSTFLDYIYQAFQFQWRIHLGEENKTHRKWRKRFFRLKRRFHKRNKNDSEYVWETLKEN